MGFLFVVLLIIPLTIYLVRQEQGQQSQATPETVLTFNPTAKTASGGDKINFDIMLSPGNNLVNFVKLAIKFDSTKLSTSAKNFTVNTASNLSIQEGPVVNNDVFMVALTIGSDPTKVIQSNTKIGTISFDVASVSDVPTQTTQISFDSNLTQVRSINGANNDAFNENVLARGEPATITIQPLGGQSISPAGNPDTSVTPRITAIPSISTGPASDNSEPICSSLTPSATTTGNAPFKLTFTANGTDTDGSIVKATFDFDDGTIEDIKTGGGLGTSSINVPITHTYYNEGEYNVSVILTDNQNATSDSVSCTVSVTVIGNASKAVSNISPTKSTTNITANPTTVGTSTDSTPGTTTNTSVENTSSVVSPSPFPPTGPNEKIVGIGALGGMLFLIGTLLFLAL